MSLTDERFFKSQDFGRLTYKHINLPIYETDEFDFYRCVEFEPGFYGKTASVLFNGNLRMSNGRYANLFPCQKISYWADSPMTARAEIKKHGAGNSILTFWAYDDNTSTFPIQQDQERLKIIDGRKCGIQDLIEKAEGKITLKEGEKQYISEVLAQNPDCLVYDSHAKCGGENYIFLEKGYHKLALRELRLRFSSSDGGAHNKIVCADTSDYSPHIEHYGEYFAPKARIQMDGQYLGTDEYMLRKKRMKSICERRIYEPIDFEKYQKF